MAVEYNTPSNPTGLFLMRTTLNQCTVLIIGLLAVVLVIMGIKFFASSNKETLEPKTKFVGGSKTKQIKSVTVRVSRSKKTETFKARSISFSETDAHTDMQSGPVATLPTTNAESEVKAPREQAVAAWESLVGQVVEQKDAPTFEQALRVKAIFDKLDKEDKLDCLQSSLNLLPDKQFSALCAILYDKTEDLDVLDAVFSDALNRPEEIKNTLMKELRKDREHPMFFESARILDVVEPEEQ